MTARTQVQRAEHWIFQYEYQYPSSQNPVITIIVAQHAENVSPS
jgi:hypothetical protein